MGINSSCKLKRSSISEQQNDGTHRRVMQMKQECRDGPRHASRYSGDYCLDAAYFSRLGSKILRCDRLLEEFAEQDRQTKELSARLISEMWARFDAYHAWLKITLPQAGRPVRHAVTTTVRSMAAGAKRGIRDAFFARRGSAVRMSQDMHRAGFVLPPSLIQQKTS